MNFRLAFIKVIDEELLLMDEIASLEYRMTVLKAAAKRLDKYAIDNHMSGENGEWTADMILSEYIETGLQSEVNQFKLDVLEEIMNKSHIDFPVLSSLNKKPTEIHWFSGLGKL